MGPVLGCKGKDGVNQVAADRNASRAEKRVHRSAAVSDTGPISNGDMEQNLPQRSNAHPHQYAPPGQEGASIPSADSGKIRIVMNNPGLSGSTRPSAARRPSGSVPRFGAGGCNDAATGGYRIWPGCAMRKYKDGSITTEPSIGRRCGDSLSTSISDW